MRITVSPRVAICFAGDVLPGLTAVRNFASGNNAGIGHEELINQLRAATADTRTDVEFLVVRGGTHGALHRIRRGTIEENSQIAWIGDAAGFERFQQARHAPVSPVESALDEHVPAGARAMRRLIRSMQAVIDDPSVPSVGDFCASMAWRAEGFNYLSSSFVHVGRDVVIKPGDDLLQKMAQPVSDGGFAVSVVEPERPGTPALGLSFPRARLAMLYLPLQLEGAQVLHEVSANDFPKAVLERFGVSMMLPSLRESRK